tara:strand:+ start:170 stop:376 length:207 start_codon:yes stop_codon:yes gene_type:complete
MIHRGYNQINEIAKTHVGKEFLIILFKKQNVHFQLHLIERLVTYEGLATEQNHLTYGEFHLSQVMVIR